LLLSLQHSYPGHDPRPGPLSRRQVDQHRVDRSSNGAGAYELARRGERASGRRHRSGVGETLDESPGLWALDQ